VPTRPPSHKPPGARTSQQQRQQQDQARGSACSRGYDARWRKARAAYLASHPLCVWCQDEGRLEPAVVVDHVRPHKGDPGLFWDEQNWQALCKPHHDRKTARQDGAFGRAPREGTKDEGQAG